MQSVPVQYNIRMSYIMMISNIIPSSSVAVAHTLIIILLRRATSGTADGRCARMYIIYIYIIQNNDLKIVHPLIKREKNLHSVRKRV